MRVVITGAAGFVGRNLVAVLRQRPGVDLVEHDVGDDPGRLAVALRDAAVVYHLAGVNRPETPDEFATGNTELTAKVCGMLAKSPRPPKVVLSSSIQAEQDNPYGVSKRGAEEALRRYCDATGAEGVVYRLKNLFGKWSRPNYNTVVATFCHNVAHDLPLQISDPSRVVDLTYIDDVIAAFVAELQAPAVPGLHYAPSLRSHPIPLGDLAEAIRGFHAHRATLRLPDLSSPFTRALYATYLSFVRPERHGYQLDVKSDARGSLAEFIKSPHAGQLFVSRTRPGITRGNHFHHTKTEKFMVVEGEGVVRMRQIHGDAVVEFHVRGDAYQVVDIPPGYTHSIENVGVGDMVTLFWSSEIFDPARPDTFAATVRP